MISTLRNGLLVLLAMLPLVAGAVTGKSAHDLIQDSTSELLSDLAAHRAQYRANPDAFFTALDRIIGPAVDAEGISRSIMTIKYSRNATPAQMTRFQESFKRSLMRFYGNALLEYNNQGITVGPAKDENGTRTSVDMQVKGTNGAVYPVSYTLEKINGEWKVRNVIVNGINLGKLFRDQFTEAMQRNGNNLDKTIDNWGSEVDKVKEKADQETSKAKP